MSNTKHVGASLVAENIIRYIHTLLIVLLYVVILCSCDCKTDNIGYPGIKYAQYVPQGQLFMTSKNDYPSDNHREWLSIPDSHREWLSIPDNHKEWLIIHPWQLQRMIIRPWQPQKNDCLSHLIKRYFYIPPPPRIQKKNHFQTMVPNFSDTL